MFSKTYTGYIDNHGLWHEHEDGNIRVRYDQFDSPQCVKHNCSLSLCKERHDPCHRDGWIVRVIER